MDKYTLRTIREIRKYSEETFGQGFDSDEDAYVDAMMNGEYHEERAGLACLATELASDDVVRLFVPVACGLVTGSVANREGDPGLAMIMAAHESLVRWSRRQLDPAEPLLQELKLVRGLIVDELTRDKSFGWWQTLEQMHVVEAAVYHLMGLRLFDLESEYDSIVHGLENQ